MRDVHYGMSDTAPQLKFAVLQGASMTGPQRGFIVSTADSDIEFGNAQARRDE